MFKFWSLGLRIPYTSFESPRFTCGLFSDDELAWLECRFAEYTATPESYPDRPPVSPNASTPMPHYLHLRFVHIILPLQTLGLIVVRRHRPRSRTDPLRTGSVFPCLRKKTPWPKDSYDFTTVDTRVFLPALSSLECVEHFQWQGRPNHAANYPLWEIHSFDQNHGRVVFSSALWSRDEMILLQSRLNTLFFQSVAPLYQMHSELYDEMNSLIDDNQVKDANKDRHATLRRELTASAREHYRLPPELASMAETEPAHAPDRFTYRDMTIHKEEDGSTVRYRVANQTFLTLGKAKKYIDKQAR